MDEIKLHANGVIEMYHFNDARSKIYDIKKDKENNDFVVFQEESGEVVMRAATRDLARRYYFDKVEMDLPFLHLRYDWNVENGITIKSICNILDQFPELGDLVHQLFPNFSLLGDTYDSPQKYIVGQNIVIDGKVQSKFIQDTIPGGQTPGMDTALEINKFQKVYKDQELIFDGESHYSFLDVLQLIFGGHDLFPVVLTKDGLFEDGTDHNIDSPLAFLLHPCRLSSDLTLGDIFNFVAADEELKTFISMYSTCSGIDLFHTEAKQPVVPDPEDSKLWYLEIYKNTKMNQKRKYYKVRTISHYCEFHAIGEVCEQDKTLWDEVPNHTQYSVSATPLNKIAHLNVRIKKDHTLFLEGEKQFDYAMSTAEAELTLLEILDSIYDDISFYGSPEGKESFMEEMSQRLEDVKGDLSNGKTYPTVEDMMKDMLDEDEYEELYGEDTEHDDDGNPKD